MVVRGSAEGRGLPVEKAAVVHVTIPKLVQVWMAKAVVDAVARKVEAVS